MENILLTNRVDACANKKSSVATKSALACLALACAAILFHSGCSTQPLRASYQRLPAVLAPTVQPFGASTRGIGNEPLYTNVFRASETLCLAYTPRTTPRDLKEMLHFRIVRDDPNDVFGYEGEEMIVGPREMLASTNVQGSVTYSYTFERAGFISHEYLGPAKQYRCTAEYWKKRRDPQRFQFSELLYLLPVVNVVYIYLADYVRRDAHADPVLEQQVIRVVD